MNKWVELEYQVNERLLSLINDCSLEGLSIEDLEDFLDESEDELFGLDSEED